MTKYRYTATFTNVVNVPDGIEDVERWIATNVLWGEDFPDGVEVEPVREENGEQ